MRLIFIERFFSTFSIQQQFINKIMMEENAGKKVHENVFLWLIFLMKLKFSCDFSFAFWAQLNPTKFHDDFNALK